MAISLVTCDLLRLPRWSKCQRLGRRNARPSQRRSNLGQWQKCGSENPFPQRWMAKSSGFFFTSRGHVSQEACYPTPSWQIANQHVTKQQMGIWWNPGRNQAAARFHVAHLWGEHFYCKIRSPASSYLPNIHHAFAAHKRLGLFCLQKSMVGWPFRNRNSHPSPIPAIGKEQSKSMVPCCTCNTANAPLLITNQLET